VEEQLAAPQDAANDALGLAQRELAACRQQRRFADAALRAISDAVVIVDLEGKVTLLNPVAAHLTGWTEGESLERPLGDVVRIVDEQGNGIDPLAPDSSWHFHDVAPPRWTRGARRRQRVEHRGRTTARAGFGDHLPQRHRRQAPHR
jgi:PAS domain-containing protein